MTCGPTDGAAHTLRRFLLAAVALGALCHLLQRTLVEHWLPLVRVWLDLVDDTFRTIDLSVVHWNGEDMIRRTVTAQRIHVVGQTVVWTGRASRLQDEVGAGLVLQPLVLGAALVLAWPWSRYQELALRAMIALPLLVLATLLDVPLLIYSLEWSSELKLLDPQRDSLLVQWGDIMNSGGRFVLAALAAVAAVGIARRAEGAGRSRLTE